MTPRKPKSEHKPVGRPTKYEPRFCQEVEDDMREGYSLTAFAGKIGVDRATLTNWTDEHPEFLAAVSRGKALRLRCWEKMGIDVAAKGTGGPGASTVIVFGLKNMGGDEWVDTSRREITGKDGEPFTVNIEGRDADL